MKLEAAIDRFITQLHADGRISHTIGQYRRHIRLLARWLQEWFGNRENVSEPVWPGTWSNRSGKMI